MSARPILLPLGEVVGIHGACGGVSRVTYRPPRGVVPRGPGVQTCDRCGADYNSSGQMLADRSQWGEETGESLADILRIR